MYTGLCEDTLCSNCVHREVCSLTKEFLAAQNAVDEVSVNIGQRENGTTFKKLYNFDWIKRVKLECIHYIQKRSMRDDHLAKTINCSTNSVSSIRCMEDPIY